MEILTFLADWALNIIGGVFVTIGIAVMLFFMGAGFFTSSKPSKGFIEDTVVGGGIGCMMTALGAFICILICGFGIWLIESF